MERAAILSVSDTKGLLEFAKGLRSRGFMLLATSGTKKFLSDHGIDAVAIEEYTGQKEILDGRVKTLHPKIHAGILAKRDKVAHLETLKLEGIASIDVVAVNLYPLLKKLKQSPLPEEVELVESIDVGGPTMIRAAAKNFRHVYPVIDPSDYERVLEAFKSGREDFNLRRELAAKVFFKLAEDNLEAARYLSSERESYGEIGSSNYEGVLFSEVSRLRYGENPHQQGAFYHGADTGTRCWEQLHGKGLSFNNVLDLDAALSLIISFPESKATVGIIKHLNPCGLAVGSDVEEALSLAKECDPRSHFGGIVAFNREVTEGAALSIVEDFAEIVIAPSFENEALSVLKKRKNLRVIKVNRPLTERPEIRVLRTGILVQGRDNTISDVSEADIVSERSPTASELQDLEFAWRACAHVKSNAIVLVKDRKLLGVGAGQMSRIDSAELAISKARTHNHDLIGGVAASDAFFPFSDSLEALAGVGVRAVIAPAGAKRDGEVIEMANKLNLALLFTKDRHFRH